MMTVEKSDHDDGLKLHDLRCFDAVVRTGSFQQAAGHLGRSHPSVFAAVGRLEARLGLLLLDRSGYRVRATDAGRSLHAHVAVTLADAARLSAHARLLAGGSEATLRVVLGDLVPRQAVLKLLSGFFAIHPGTRLDLDYEAVGGPGERLNDGAADLVFHRFQSGDPQIERIDLMEVRLIPVAAPGFLPGQVAANARPEHLRAYTQCVIRDTASISRQEAHFLIEGAPRCSVPDHAMKRELILHGMAWGHLPEFMVADDLQQGRLLRIGGDALPGRTETLSAARRADLPHGPVAEDLWAHIRDHFAGQPG